MQDEAAQIQIWCKGNANTNTNANTILAQKEVVCSLDSEGVAAVLETRLDFTARPQPRAPHRLQSIQIHTRNTDANTNTHTDANTNTQTNFTKPYSCRSYLTALKL